MLYQLNIDFQKQDFVDKKYLYYAVLGGFLSLFEDNQEIYHAILKLSFSIHDVFTIHITIDGEKHYNDIINTLLHKKNDTSLSIQ